MQYNALCNLRHHKQYRHRPQEWQDATVPAQARHDEEQYGDNRDPAGHVAAGPGKDRLRRADRPNERTGEQEQGDTDELAMAPNQSDQVQSVGNDITREQPDAEANDGGEAKYIAP